MNFGGGIGPTGRLSLRKLSLENEMGLPRLWHEIVLFGLPREGLLAEVARWRYQNMHFLWRGWLRALRGTPLGKLHVVVIRNGLYLPYGLASLDIVTDNGAGFVADAFPVNVEPENMKFHGIGTGTTAAATTDTALQTELTTEYNPNNTRATGSMVKNGAKVWRTIGTNTLDSGTPAVTEWGVLSQAAVGGGVLLDHVIFAAINLTGANGDGLQTTFDFTVNSGG